MQVLTTLGAGVVLAWLSLPLLLWVTRRDRRAEPASRHRALIRALVLSALLLGIPALRAALGTSLVERQLPEALIGSGLLGAPSAQPSAPPRIGAVVLPCIGAVWLLLVGLRSLAIALRLQRLRGLVSRSVAPSRSLHEALAHEARAVGVPTPALLVSGEVRVPFTARVLRPTIVVSTTHAETADPETLRLIFRHELEHVARRDVPVDVAVTLLLALFAGHPNARSLAREIRFARECAVDANVAPSAPRAYASLLVAMAEQVEEARELQVGMDDTELSARVRRILEGPSGQRRSARLAPVALAFALLACSGAAATPPESSAGSGATPAATAPGFSVRLVAPGVSRNRFADSAIADLPLEDVVLRREDVLGVQVAPANEKDPNSGRAIILELTPAGEQAIARSTAQNVGRHMAILVGDKVVAAPVIRAPIQGPNLQITTNTDAELEALASVLGANLH